MGESKGIALFTEMSSLFSEPFLADEMDCSLYVLDPRQNDFFKAGKQGTPITPSFIAKVITSHL